MILKDLLIRNFIVFFIRFKKKVLNIMGIMS